MHGRGGAHVAGEACMVGVGHMWQGRRAWWWVGGSMRGRRDSHCSGRYACYWNAFLLMMVMDPLFI